MSFAATDADVVADADRRRPTRSKLFADSSGVPATGGVNLIADRAANGPILENARHLALHRPRRPQHRQRAVLPLAADRAGPDERRRLGRFRPRQGRHARGPDQRQAARQAGDRHPRPARRAGVPEPAFARLLRPQPAERGQEEPPELHRGHAPASTSTPSSRRCSPARPGAQFAPLHYYFVRAMDSMYAHLTTRRGAAAFAGGAADAARLCAIYGRERARAAAAAVRRQARALGGRTRSRQVAFGARAGACRNTVSSSRSRASAAATMSRERAKRASALPTRPRCCRSPSHSSSMSKRWQQWSVSPYS